jgi:hypothetical protein
MAEELMNYTRISKNSKILTFLGEENVNLMTNAISQTSRTSSLNLSMGASVAFLKQALLVKTHTQLVYSSIDP